MRRGWRAGLLLAAAIAFGVAPALAADGHNALEYQVKAAFLFNFARFVTWPPSRFSAPDSPIELCVLGPDPFGPALDEAVRGKVVSGRRLRVRRSPQPEALSACHVVFIGETDPVRIAGALAALNGRSVLTVHEGGAPLAGGVVRFLIEDRSVRFEINTVAARRESFHLSAKLLSLARLVQV